MQERDRRVFFVVPKEAYRLPHVKNRIAIASAIWGVALLVSRLIGLVRESVFAHTLGVSKAADVYQAAFRIPDWFSTLLAGGALSMVFIPIFSAHIERGDEARGWRTFSNMANLLLAIMAVVGSAFWIFAPFLSQLLAPGFSPEQLALLTRLTRIILPAQVFHILGGLLSASLLARDRHLVPAVAPLLYSVGIIVGGLVWGTAEGFAWGVVAGAFVGPFLLPLIVTLRGGLKWSPVLDLRDPDLRLYLSRWVPVLLGGSLVLLDDTLLARFGSTLGEGAIATLGYAKTLMRAPMGIFGAAVGFAAYPALTRLALTGKVVDLYDLTTSATRRVLILAFLSQVGLTVAAPEIGTLVYGTARISPERMGELGLCLSLFSLALGPWSAQIMVSRAFYAMGKGWVPARISLIVIALCTPLYWLLGKHFGAPGLAAASSITVTISVCTLQAALRKQTGGTGGYGDLLGKLLFATAMAIGGTLLVRSLLPAMAFSRLDALWRAGVLGAVACSLFLGIGLAIRLPGVGQPKKLTALTKWTLPFLLVLGALLGFIVPIVKVRQSLGQDWKYFDSQSLVVRSAVLFYKRFPIHDPWVMGGTDLLANPQSRVFSPAVLFDIIGGPYYGNFLYLMAYAVLGAFGGYRLLRAHGVSAASAVTGALLFVNSTWFSLHFAEGHLPFGPFLLLPWVLHFALTLSRPESAFGIFSLLALFLLDGGMYPFIFSVVLVGLLLLTRRIKPIALAVQIKGHWAVWLVCAISFILLTSAKIVPVISVHGKRLPALDMTSMQPAEVARALFYPDQTVSFLPPGSIHRFHEYGCYLGGAAVFVVLGGLISWKLLKQNAVYLVLMALFLWAATGWGEKRNPWTLFQHVPLLNNAHVQSRMFLLFHLFFIIVLCRSLDAIRHWFVARAAQVFLVAEVLVTTANTWSSTFRDYPGPEYQRLIRSTTIIATIHDAPKPDLYFDGTKCAKFIYEPAGIESNTHYVGDGAYQGELYATKGQGTLSLGERTPGRVVFGYESREPLKVEVNTNILKGWRVRAGVAKVYATPDGLVGLDLPAGKQTIAIEYAPQYLPWVLAAFGTGVLLWVCVAMHLVRLRRKPAVPLV